MMMTAMASAAAITPANSSSLNHVFMMLADDWGSYDASFRIRQLGREPDVATPVIDGLAQRGLTFDNYYVQPICTPTRASLLSGRYSIHTGSEHILFGAFEPSCLPVELPLMPTAFKAIGYQTHMIGKWHIGYVNESCAPWGRDFDSYIGYLGGNEGYYQHGAGGFWDWHACGLGGDGGRPGNATRSAGAAPSACDDCSTVHAGEYSTTVYTRRAQSLIEGWRAGEPALFVYLAWQAVSSHELR